MLTTFPASASEMNLHTHKGKYDTLDHDGETSGVKFSLMQALNEVSNPSFCCSATSQNVTFTSGTGRERHGEKMTLSS